MHMLLAVSGNHWWEWRGYNRPNPSLGGDELSISRGVLVFFLKRTWVQFPYNFTFAKFLLLLEGKVLLEGVDSMLEALYLIVLIFDVKLEVIHLPFQKALERHGLPNFLKRVVEAKSQGKYLKNSSTRSFLQKRVGISQGHRALRIPPRIFLAKHVAATQAVLLVAFFFFGALAAVVAAAAAVVTTFAV